MADRTNSIQLNKTFKQSATLTTAIIAAILTVGGYGLAFGSHQGAAAILIALPSLFYLGRLPTSRRSFYCGLILGVAMYGPHLFFFTQVFGKPGMLLWIIAAMPIAIFILLLSHTHRRLGPYWAMALTPMCWMGIEFFRSELYYLKFAWILPGQVLAFVPGMRWLSVGSYGLGFICACAAAMVVGPDRKWKWCGAVLSIVLAGLMYLPKAAQTSPISKLHVAGVQFEDPSRYEVLQALEKLAADHPEAQIWVMSELTFRGTVPESVCDVVKKHGKYLIAGGFEVLADKQLQNTAFVVGPDGTVVFKQGKSVPVQFMSDGIPAPSRKVWNSPWGKIGIGICYDISYANVMDDFVRQGAEGLILPTMDQQHWGLYERRMLHGRMAPIRSAEYGIPVFGVWSSGESQLTDSRGQIIASGSYPGQGEVIAGPFDLKKNGSVPLDRIPAYLATFGTVGLMIYLMIRKDGGISEFKI